MKLPIDTSTIWHEAPLVMDADKPLLSPTRPLMLLICLLCHHLKYVWFKAHQTLWKISTSSWCCVPTHIDCIETKAEKNHWFIAKPHAHAHVSLGCLITGTTQKSPHGWPMVPPAHCKGNPIGFSWWSVIGISIDFPLVSENLPPLV